ncbi:MAG: sigma-70 family RNA polymerase sigma factor [Clostridia bacterium]|nr:sigma-70 family RNA polymerase sigma factor [Clostridia bacterium]
MDFTEKLTEQYAKKIYGFAWKKTGNTHEAEDLSQNILLTLCKIDFAGKDIADMDGYIWRVCNYTWSNFVRQNKPIWESARYVDELENSVSEENLEDELVKNETYVKLRRELMYMSRMKREITIMFYYDGKSGKEIAESLGIPHSTVRWHLSEAKKTLKERIDMKDTIYRPKKLEIYFSGNMNDVTKFSELKNDLLSQNICIACAGKALTVEEIAQTLCMSALFIENKLENLLYMGYIEKTGAAKYRTTFFVQDEDFITAKSSYEFQKFTPVAEIIYNEAKAALPEIRKIGFMGSDLPENLLMWAVCEIAAHNYENELLRSFESKVSRPLRGDGSKHWIIASVHKDSVLAASPALPAPLADYIRYSGGAAGKHTANNELCLQQFDPNCVTPNRTPLMSKEISELGRIHTIITQNVEPNEYDKELIVLWAEKGFVDVENGKPRFTIPYFTSAEHEKFESIINERIVKKALASYGKDFAAEYAEFTGKQINAPVSDEERIFVKQNIYKPNAIGYLLFTAGKLEKPTEEEAKSICTIILEKP